MTALLSALRHARRVDTIAAWSVVWAALGDTEVALTEAYLSALHRASCHPEDGVAVGEWTALHHVLDRLGVDTGELGVPDGLTHAYLSTACLHAAAGRPELHDYCANKQGQAGPKKPAQCKWCESQCRCSCHRRGAG